MVLYTTNHRPVKRGARPVAVCTAYAAFSRTPITSMMVEMYEARLWLLGAIAALRWTGTFLFGEFTRGRYRARYFVLFCAGVVLLDLPFLIAGASDASLLLPVLLLFIWLDWRHQWFFEHFEEALASRPTIPDDETVRLRATQMGPSRVMKKAKPAEIHWFLDDENAVNTEFW